MDGYVEIYVCSAAVPSVVEVPVVVVVVVDVGETILMVA